MMSSPNPNTAFEPRASTSALSMRRVCDSVVLAGVMFFIGIASAAANDDDHGAEVLQSYIDTLGLAAVVGQMIDATDLPIVDDDMSIVYMEFRDPDIHRVIETSLDIRVSIDRIKQVVVDIACRRPEISTLMKNGANFIDVVRDVESNDIKFYRFNYDDCNK